MMFLLRGGEGGATLVDAPYFIPCVNNITTVGISFIYFYDTKFCVLLIQVRRVPDKYSFAFRRKMNSTSIAVTDYVYYVT